MNNRNTYRVRRRRRRKKAEKFTRGMRITLFALFVLFLIVFVGLLIKIVMINQSEGDRYKKAALSQHSYSNNILSYQRGAIKDRNNTTLAVSVRKFNLVLEPRNLLADGEMMRDTVEVISDFFGVTEEELEQIIANNPDSMYQRPDTLRELDAEKVDEFKTMMQEEEAKESKDETKLKLGGVWFEETYVRNYPLQTVACNLVGFMGADDKGTYGIEESYNEELSGVNGRSYGYFDSDMNLQRTIKEAKNGNSVVLTIDANVQRIVEEQIADFQKNGIGAERVAVMIMNPNNGEILAMASDSTFDLNQPRELTTMYTKKQIEAMTEEEKTAAFMGMWSNYCIGSAYEPGSTYKPFTVAAALDENLVSGKSTFNCTGFRQVADAKIHCSNRNGHGVLDLRQSMMNSCNCALMDIGEKLERTLFHDYNELYGFGQRTGIDLPGETSGQIHSEEQLNPVEIATSSFGQTQTVTMVQMLSGFSSLINGGSYYQPHVVKEIQNEDGNTIRTINPVVVKKTTTESTSEQLRSYLKSTVEEGTAGPAKVKGYSIGGKTGTAEKRPVEEKNYLVSFIGCVPADNPEMAIYVIIDEPHVEDQAHSSYATEFSSKIMKKVLPFLGLYADKQS